MYVLRLLPVSGFWGERSGFFWWRQVGNPEPNTEVVELIRVANWILLKPDFDFFFFQCTWLFYLRLLVFFQSEKLGSGKTLSELHITYSLQIFSDTSLWLSSYMVQRISYCSLKMFEDFTVGLKMSDVFHMKKMYDNVITGKESASKDWNCSLLYQSFWLVLISILCVVMHVLYMCIMS